MDDLRFGRIARVLRQRLRLRQVDVGSRAKCSQDVISRIERGRLDGLTVRRLRRVLAVFDAELVLYVRWRGGEVDCLVDRGHPALGEDVATTLGRAGWEVVPEVSYSNYGERGSIDLVGWHAESGTLLVIEVKTELTSIEETLRRHDAKARLASKAVADRLGWVAAQVVRLLVLPDGRTPRRQVERHASLFARPYPLRGWELRRWLAQPSPATPSTRRPTGGLWFLPPNGGVRTGRGLRTRRRVARLSRAPIDASER